MDCTAALAMLHPYLDGELDRGSVREFEAHLEQCPDCARELAAYGELRQALRTQAPRHAAPAALRERLQAELGTGTRAPVVAWSRWRLAASWLLALGLGAGLGLAGSNLRGGGGGAQALLEHDLFASHLRALAAASPVDVVSSDRHTVKPWFAGRIAVAPPVADFAEQGFPLAGARIDYVGTRRVAVLVYRHGQHVIDVFVLPDGGDAGPAAVARSLGYTATPVELGGQPAVIVSDLDAQESARLRRLLAGG